MNVPRFRFLMRWKVWGARWRAFRATPSGQRWLAWGRSALSLAVLGMVVYQLWAVGWADVLTNLPTTPWFYVLMVGGYGVLPAVEVQIYRTLWHLPWRKSLPQMFIKRVYNAQMVEYAGEAYFYTWARRHVARSTLLAELRDANILSGLVALGIAFGFLAVLVGMGYFDVSLFRQGWLRYGLPILAVFLLAVGVAMASRKVVFSLPLALGLQIAGWHVVQVVGQQAIRLLQWGVAVPEVGWVTWLQLLGLTMLIERLPGLPNKDLLAVGAGMGVAGHLDVAAALVAGPMLVSSVGVKLLNVGVLLVAGRAPAATPLPPISRDGLQADAPPATHPPEASASRSV